MNESAIIGALRHLQNQAETGIAGVRMHDARGQYLPESKRGFPDLISSFFKIDIFLKYLKSKTTSERCGFFIASIVF